MILLIDIGNTRIKWAQLSAGKLSQPSAIVYKQKTIDSNLTAEWQGIPLPSKIYLASVSSTELKQQLINVAEHLWPDISIQEIYTVKSALGVTNAYSEPFKLGIDRWLAMLAAFHYHKTAVCVVDCGTAITLDVIDQQGMHLGGMIMPGLSLLKQALSKGTADLNICPEIHQQGLANYTEAAIFNGTISAIKGFIESGLAQYEQPVLLVLTGGDADFILARLKLDASVDKALVLKGLALLVNEQVE